MVLTTWQMGWPSNKLSPPKKKEDDCSELRSFSLSRLSEKERDRAAQGQSLYETTLVHTTPTPRYCSPRPPMYITGQSPPGPYRATPGGGGRNPAPNLSLVSFPCFVLFAPPRLGSSFSFGLSLSLSFSQYEPQSVDERLCWGQRAKAQHGPSISPTLRICLAARLSVYLRSAAPPRRCCTLSLLY